MENEEFLNNLKQVNTLIDVQLSRLESIERNNPKQAVYLQQTHNALIKPKESCNSCFVLPAISVGGGNGGGIPSNEMHFTTLAGSVDYVGTEGDQILLRGGNIVDITVTDQTVTFNAPRGKHIVKLVESSGRSNYVSVGGEALVKLHNFPALSTVTKFNFSTYNYNQLPNLTKVPNVFPSNIIDIEGMFYQATSFNQDLSNWNVSNVTDMGSMFNTALAFNQPLNNWDVSNVTGMQAMFEGASAFNQDLSMWCVSNFPTRPAYFNNGASLLVGANLPVWGTCPTP